jgi:hypothetical protein
MELPAAAMVRECCSFSMMVLLAGLLACFGGQVSLQDGVPYMNDAANMKACERVQWFGQAGTWDMASRDGAQH